MNNKIYVICPYGLITGGPDALHQMVYYLTMNGYDASIVYSDINSHKYKIPNQYKIYIKDYLLLNEINDEKGNTIVVPETENNLLNKYVNVKKYIWWLSVDNDLNYSGVRNKIKKILKKIRIKNLKKLYKIHTLKNVLQHSKYDFSKDNNIIHLCASYYAFDYVINNCKNKDNVYLCIEPISKIFIDKSELVTKNKENIILYNPSKNYDFTKKIINNAREYKFIPLKSFSQEELIDLYQKAKVYIDFGNFPGAERIPKEAVINGCCIITGKYGASKFYKDVPIPDDCKIDAKEENIEKIIKKIKDIFENYDQRIDDYSAYRDTVWKLENNFIEQLKGVFKNEK